MSRLILEAGSISERVIELREGANSIGRTKDNDVFVLHRSLSRSHARIVLDGPETTLEDLGSKNGTFVDGTRVDRMPLTGPHRIRCGDVVMQYVPGNGEQPAQRVTGHAAPSIIFDPANDPLCRSLGELLGATRAASGASALHVHAVDSTTRDRAKLEILLKAAEELSSPSSIDVLLGRILELGFEILDIDRAAVVMTVDGTPTARVSKARTGVASHETYSRQIVGYVLERSVAALFADTRRDERLRPDGSILDHGIWSAMCAPLRARGKLLGALYVDNVTLPNRFGEEDLHFVCAFANQAAIAIDNARLGARLADEAAARSTLMRFFPPSAANAILTTADTLAAKEVEATALFCDISDYTAMSSTMTPMQVIELLNAYFPMLAEIVFRHEGTLEKYIGDAMLAVWGAPFSHEDDADRAVRAAVDMQRAVRDATSDGRLPESLAIHVGINTGNVAAGSIGSEQYLQYATIGDATNVASRICSEAQAGEVFIDDRTAQKLGAGIELDPLGLVHVKGKAEPLSLHRVRWS